jgi:hypothetical protein
VGPGFELCLKAGGGGGPGGAGGGGGGGGIFQNKSKLNQKIQNIMSSHSILNGYWGLMGKKEEEERLLSQKPTDEMKQETS